MHDMPCLRRWWCTVLVENLEGLPTLPNREYRWPGDVWTQFSASLGRGNMRSPR
ncbi:hypothetical protein IRJ41_001921, partial [Triplophysa rosa]